MLICIGGGIRDSLLILFGGFDFVRTFAAKNDGTITCRLERVQASVVTAFFFCYINCML